MYSNIFSSEIRQQNRTEQNRTEPLQGFLRSQNRTGFLVKIEQSGLQNRHFQDFIANKCRTTTRLISFAKQNYYKAYFIAKQNLAKFISVV